MILRLVWLIQARLVVWRGALPFSIYAQDSSNVAISRASAHLARAGGETDSVREDALYKWRVTLSWMLQLWDVCTTSCCKVPSSTAGGGTSKEEHRRQGRRPRRRGCYPLRTPAHCRQTLHSIWETIAGFILTNEERLAGKVILNYFMPEKQSLYDDTLNLKVEESDRKPREVEKMDESAAMATFPTSPWWITSPSTIGTHEQPINVLW